MRFHKFEACLKYSFQYFTTESLRSLTMSVMKRPSVQWFTFMRRCRCFHMHWMEAESLKETAGGTLYYIDGHLRVYYGSQAKLPRHYVARQRLCLRATNDYWVSQGDGQPVFKVNTAVDPGMLAVLEEQMVPQLLADIPNQPSEEQLKANPYLSRFRLAFDREGYSPGFFKRMWEKRIACQTYRKGSYAPWPEEEFVTTQVRLKTGQVVEWKLTKRGVKIGSKKKEMLWVREVRKITEKGHQTAILSTPKEDAALEHLCAQLTETQTKYPDTELTLIYKKVSLPVP